VAEQSVADRLKSEEERNQEIKKELEANEFELMQVGTGVVDPRNTALKFMYSQPKSEKSQSSSMNQTNTNGEDDMVREFKRKMEQKNNPDNLTDIANNNNDDNNNDDETNIKMENHSQAQEDFERKRKLKSDPNFGASVRRSKLEIEAGKKQRVGLTQEEQAERFSFLKNAPMEGAFAKNIEVRHKPFNEIIRNVQCIRCGEWGHQSGDRECALRDANPHDFARRKREDPLTYMQSEEFMFEKQKMILRHAAAESSSSTIAVGLASSSSSSNPPTGSKSLNLNTLSKTKVPISQNASSTFNQSHLLFEEDNDESDPEKEFIATLTPREKKLLLRKLRQLKTPTSDNKVENDNSSSSDSTISTKSSNPESHSINRSHNHYHRDEKKKSSSHKSKKHKRKDHEKKIDKEKP
jgi:hypothetical protein